MLFSKGTHQTIVSGGTLSNFNFMKKGISDNSANALQISKTETKRVFTLIIQLFNVKLPILNTIWVASGMKIKAISLETLFSAN